MGWLKENRWGIGVAVAAVVVAAVLLNLRPIGAGLDFKADIWGAATSVVTGLLITTLLVERSVAVFNALLFGDQQRAAELQLLGLRAATPGGSAADAVAAVHKAKERFRLLVSFAAGLFVSLAGVRTLEDLMVTSVSTTTGAQTVVTQITPPTWFYPVDVLLTAGLIAGGSNGLAYLLQILKDRVAPSDGSNGSNNPQGGANRASAAAAAAKRPALTVSPAALRARMMTTG